MTHARTFTFINCYLLLILILLVTWNSAKGEKENKGCPIIEYLVSKPHSRKKKSIKVQNYNVKKGGEYHL